MLLILDCPRNSCDTHKQQNVKLSKLWNIHMLDYHKMNCFPYDDMGESRKEKWAKETNARGLCSVHIHGYQVQHQAKINYLVRNQRWSFLKSGGGTTQGWNKKDIPDDYSRAIYAVFPFRKFPKVYTCNFCTFMFLCFTIAIGLS